jgi:hypothetical protein
MRKNSAGFILVGVFLLAPASVMEPAGSLEPNTGQAVVGTLPLQSHPAKVAATGLCELAGRVTSVTATRSRPLNPETFTFARVATGSMKTKVRAAAKTLCALPQVPPGVQACPVDLGVLYTLRFLAAGDSGIRSARPVVVSAWGCRIVTGLGPTRWVAASPNFWRVLGNALNLRSATNRTFTGTLIGG